ncbi:MAG: hydantoinase/oxoprolinase family protein [Alphaproteobacteria bacterium]
MKEFALGIDIGGTFTDIVVFDPSGARVAIWKESTTPDDPSRGVIAGIRRVLDRDGIAPTAIGRVVHATTLFTNALIERKGARTGLITTEGFRDVLEIARERKYELYDIFIEMPTPIVPRRLRREVAERLAPDGTIEIPLDEAALAREADALVADGVTSLAIVFLHSYANPVHERRAVEIVRARHPGLSISASCDVAPEVREYLRASTTVANAFSKPLAEVYLDRLVADIAGLGIDAPFFLMLSNGGLTHVEEAKRTPVHLLESGPAAGALAGAWFGRNAGERHVLAFDMGGTTAKLSLIDDGEPLVAYGFEAAREKRFMKGSGLPILIPTIELIEIGAGGGSIAYRDELDLMKVGPQSSGAQPGPACYGRGGSDPTVTDADLILGYLNADFFLGGEMAIDLAAARAAMKRLADALGIEPERAAWGIHDVVNENMAGAARVHLAEHGKEPRDYALLATGGAAPVHAYHVARKLGVGRLICPPAAGVGSTIGLLMAPARIDRVASATVRLADADWPRIEANFRQLEQDALEVLSGTGADLAERTIRRAADMRYAGQGSELTVPLPAGPYGADTGKAALAAFEEIYRRLFHRTPPDVAAQLVSVRVSVSAPVPGAAFTLASHGRGSTDARKGSRPVWFPDGAGWVDTPVWARYALAPGSTVDGPAIFEENESTLVVGPGARCAVREDGSIVVDLPAA